MTEQTPTTPLDVEVLLHDHLPKLNLENYMEFTEDKDCVIVKITRYLSAEDWSKINRLVQKWGGGYDSDKRTWTIPKPKMSEEEIHELGFTRARETVTQPPTPQKEETKESKVKETTVDNIRRSAEDIGQLYPILIDEETGEVLDGRNRLKADPNWKRQSVKTQDALQKLKIKHHANWHRKVVNRQKVLTEIAEETGWRGLKPFADFLDVHESTISRYLPEKYKLKHDSKHELADCKVFENFDFSLSTWIAEEERPEGYGSRDFHGNCSPTIIYGLLSQYADQNDIVFDPMVGSGTFIDVAKAMGFEKIIARDIRPVREDINKGDAENTELDNESVGFVFAHFPYWKLIQYTENENEDLSRLAYAEFISKTDRIFREMQRILKKGSFFAVMIGNMRKEGLLDIEAEFSLIGRQYFTLWDKIIKQIRTWKQETRGQRMGLAVARAKARKSTVLNHDTILVFRKD